MSADTIDHHTLTRLVEAGAVRGAHVIGQAGGWGILVKYGMIERPLAATRSRQVRTFRKLETVVDYLKGIGISRFDVDTANYDPTQTKLPPRPDRAEAMKRAHEAVAHDRWFREEVATANQEADDPDTRWVSHEEAKQQSAAWRAKWRQQADAQGDDA